MADDRVMVDTDVFSYLMKGRERADPYRPHTDGKRIAVSFVTVGELFGGAKRAGWSPQRMAKLETRLKNAVIIPYDLEVCKQYATMATLKTPQGSHRTIPANDRWIAACAMRHGLVLVTNNRADFADIPGLTVICEAPAPPLPRSPRLTGLDPTGPAAE
jgi:predicted nucleic acid-binding protein